ncbi:hypothetical protein CDAR_276131 [Caerostris darwini]|uniref:Uncharacterized protein n=1 Tax=Caerostris darwini TaxID=1538125 RepID=A0AAV4QM88_9ARAC|nr:hypothetical protein CDAR_276131 [Caerostris darwini]
MEQGPKRLPLKKTKVPWRLFSKEPDKIRSRNFIKFHIHEAHDNEFDLSPPVGNCSKQLFLYWHLIA